MTIRPATIDDIPAIHPLFYELDTDAIRFQPEHFRRGERTTAYMAGLVEGAASDFLLAVEGEEIVGFSLVFERAEKALALLVPCRYLYIQDFVVTEARRGAGIGAALMEASKAWGRARGLEYVRLSVFPANEGARRFYRRHGLHEQMIAMECAL